MSHAHPPDNRGHAAPLTGRVRPVFHMFLSLILPLPCWAVCWLFSLKAFNKTTTRSLQLPSYVIYLDMKNVPSQNPSTCSSPMYKPWHLLVPIHCRMPRASTQGVQEKALWKCRVQGSTHKHSLKANRSINAIGCSMHTFKTIYEEHIYIYFALFTLLEIIQWHFVLQSDSLSKNGWELSY